MLAPGDKGPFEKCRNAIFSDFDGTTEKYRSSKKTLHRSLPAIFSLISTRYVIRSGDADFKLVILALFIYTFNCDYICTINKYCSFQ